MKNKLVNLLLASTLVLSSIVHATDIDEKYRKGYDLVPASINTAAKENNISFYRNHQIILLKPNPKGRNNKPVPFTATVKENGDLGKPKLSKELNKLGIIGTVAYDSVAGKLYFSKYNSIEKDYALYESAIKKGKWQDPVQMKIEGTGGLRKQNSFMLSAGWSYKTIGLSGFKNPSIAKKGKRIYFTAKIRPKAYGNVGGTDIWYIDQKEDGTWTKPTNAGKNINTPSKEDYAFCVGDSILYFSSIGRGAIDLFKSKLVNGQWSKAVSMGKPYCSSVNDFNLIANDQFIYLVSARNMKGKDDIYLFRKQPDPVVVPPPVPIPPEPEPDPVIEVKKNWNFVLFYFDFDKDVLTDEFTRQFKELVEEMKQFPGETFEVDGHTDQRGSAKYNQKLSEHRANFVKQLLVKEGFPSDKIIAKGFGKRMPVVEDPKSEDDFAQNRRCEIHIVSPDGKEIQNEDDSKQKEGTDKTSDDKSAPSEVKASTTSAAASTKNAKSSDVKSGAKQTAPASTSQSPKADAKQSAKGTVKSSSTKQGTNATNSNVKTTKSSVPASTGDAKKTK